MAVCLTLASPAIADSRSVPVSDTEDASLGSQPVGDGRLHAILGLDARNGDFVRGTYDDDGASLGRVPVHAQIGLVYELARTGDKADTWLEVRSSNGFHAAGGQESAAPRAWYESNNLIGIEMRLAPDLIGAVSYAIKTSPNGIAATTHEVSAAFSLDGDSGFLLLHPGLAATWRPKGGGGLFVQGMIEPGIDVGQGETPDRLTIPIALGVGTDGFYAQGSGTRAYGRVGVAYAHPFTIGDAHLALRAEASAILRDDKLRRLDPPAASARAIRPLGMIAITYAY